MSTANVHLLGKDLSSMQATTELDLENTDFLALCHLQQINLVLSHQIWTSVSW